MRSDLIWFKSMRFASMRVDLIWCDLANWLFQETTHIRVCHYYSMNFTEFRELSTCLAQNSSSATSVVTFGAFLMWSVVESGRVRERERERERERDSTLFSNLLVIQYFSCMNLLADSSWSHRSFWNHLEPTEAIWIHLWSSGGVWTYLEPSGGIWRYLDLSGGIWSYLELLGATWAIWSHLELYGTIWTLWEPS